MLPIRTIVYPSDFSDLAEPALDLASALAHDYGAKLIICHVVPRSLRAVQNGTTLDFPMHSIEAASDRLEVIQPLDPKVSVVHELAFGDEAGEIIRVATENKADLIVMGTHGRSGFSRLLMGSVAEAVLRSAPCPVLTVRMPFELPIHDISSESVCYEKQEFNDVGQLRFFCSVLRKKTVEI